MEEKVLIKSVQYNIEKYRRKMISAGIVVTILALLIWCIVYCIVWYDYPILENLSYMFFEDLLYLLCFIPLVVFPLIGQLIHLWLRSFELTVTDKRIFGKVAWGKRVDLPVDSVSATATLSLFKGVSVSTSSGRISFLAIDNANEIYEIINNLLIERQKKRNNSADASPISNTTDEAEQLKKFKDLLDSGVITQEEFDAKKKQLLGI